MNEFFHYLMQSSGILAVFYVLYFLFLRNERFFTEIRWFLMMSIVLAAFLPLVKIPYTVLVETSQVNVSSDLSVGEWIAGSMPESLSENKTFYSIPQILMGFYLMVSLVLLMRSSIKVWQIWSMIKGKEFIVKDNCKVILLDEKIPAFSFFGYVVINREEFENEDLRNIFIHEKVHALQKHWIDLLLVEILSIIFWFNPFVWLFQIAIKQTHELLADDEVIARGFSIGQYQALLINQLMGAEVVGLANNLNYSINKKRMIMMSKDKSSKNRRFKLLVMLPVILAVVIFNLKIEKVYADSPVVTEVSNQEKVKITGVVLASDGKPIPGATVIVEGTTYGTVANRYGKFEISAAKSASINVSFVALQTKNIAVKDFVLKGKTTEKGYFLKIALDKESDVTKEDNKFSETNLKRKSPKKYKGEHVYVIVEEMPEFPGGHENIQIYLKQKISELDPKYITGQRCFVTFIITKEGKIDNVRMTRGSGNKEVDAIALELVKGMPIWSPGKEKGKPVHCSYTVPITFKS
ncbi:TonB family protein [Marinifilum sp. D714]|uniref:TonB family protein n=1 Tax=Marinifilum sp. D714 TaxID=2937523 RepID=UPI0027C5A685|nr:M56 family metallopeptidase [Marinifilum sp. D714]MDQ2177371.1 M56 family metallopeptidase [Marinifilum sp. D714]